MLTHRFSKAVLPKAEKCYFHKGFSNVHLFLFMGTQALWAWTVSKQEMNRKNKNKKKTPLNTPILYQQTTEQHSTFAFLFPWCTAIFMSYSMEHLLEELFLWDWGRETRKMIATRGSARLCVLYLHQIMPATCIVLGLCTFQQFCELKFRCSKWGKEFQ